MKNKRIMKVKIDEPCTEDWSKMKIGVKSRHCELCVKSVVDFTEMTRDEILIYLIQNQNKSTCARMLGGQTDFHFTELQAIVESARIQKGNRAFLLLSMATLALVSCQNKPNSVIGTNPSLGEIVQVDTLPSIDTTTAQVELDSIPKKHSVEIGKIETKKASCEPKKGEIETIIMGDVMLVEPEIIEVVEPEVMGLMELESHPVLDNDSAVYEFAELMPEFVGGVDSLMSYLSSQITYPKQAKKNGVEGTVYAQFVVGLDGSISEVIVVRGIGYGCDDEAIKVLNSMPKWIPGENRGKKVRVKYTLPIKFTLK